MRRWTLILFIRSQSHLLSWFVQAQWQLNHLYKREKCQRQKLILISMLPGCKRTQVQLPSKSTDKTFNLCIHILYKKPKKIKSSATSPSLFSVCLSLHISHSNDKTVLVKILLQFIVLSQKHSNNVNYCRGIKKKKAEVPKLNSSSLIFIWKPASVSSNTSCHSKSTKKPCDS